MSDLFETDRERRGPQDISFESDTGFVVARLEKDAFTLPEGEVVFRGRTFQPKDELHITLVSQEAAEKLRRHLERHPEEADRVRSAIQETDWSYRKREELYHVKEGEAESIIQMVAVPGVEPFFQALSRILDADLEIPPTHVTLLTRNDPQGIGLPTRAVFERLAQGRVRPEELEPVRAGPPGSVDGPD